MNIGFVGAGKVGFSLGKYFAMHKISVAGYYSKNPEAAKEAADFTGTRNYVRLEDLVQDCEVLFLTVPDDVIKEVWSQICAQKVTGKIICHCSGVLSSEVFSDITKTGNFGYSIHPLLAVNDKLHSYQELSHALFTIEGDEQKKEEMTGLLKKCGNQVLTLQKEEKVRYHAAAVFASNLVLGLAETAMEELALCGFSKEAARAAIAPFMQANVSHLLEMSEEEALTGPVERGDSQTVRLHMEKLSGENREIYRLLSKKALEIAKRKNKDRDYTKVSQVLCEERKKDE